MMGKGVEKKSGNLAVITQQLDFDGAIPEPDECTNSSRQSAIIGSCAYLP